MDSRGGELGEQEKGADVEDADWRVGKLEEEREWGRCEGGEALMHEVGRRRWAEAVAEQGRQRRLKGGGGGARSASAVAAAAVAMLVSSWPRQGVAAAARRRAAAAATAVGLLPRPSVSSHSRWRRLISFSNDS